MLGWAELEQAHARILHSPRGGLYAAPPRRVRAHGVREDRGSWAIPDGEIPVEILAYVAGVIDSDGSISILRETYAMRVLKTTTQPSFSERVTIRQLEPEAVDLVHRLFGGCRSVIVGKHKNRKRQPLQSVQLADRKASRLLAAVLPYLRIKRRQAELCLEMRRLKEESREARFAYGRGHRGGGKRPGWITAAMEEVRAEIARLNRVDGRAALRNPQNVPLAQNSSVRARRAASAWTLWRGGDEGRRSVGGTLVT